MCAALPGGVAVGPFGPADGKDRGTGVSVPVAGPGVTGAAMTSASSPPEAALVTPLRRAPAQLLRVTTTPGMLRLLIIGLVALCLAWGAVAAWMVSQRASAASDVAATTDATAWYAAHQRVRSLDDGGAHSKAVLSAIGSGPGDSGTL